MLCPKIGGYALSAIFRDQHHTDNRPHVIRTLGGPSGMVVEMDKAQRIANKQKQISISEFFEKNKHFLGFDTCLLYTSDAADES